MITCRVVVTMLGVVLLLAVNATAQPDANPQKALADSSKIVTLKDGTTYSKDTLALVYLYRLYACKPPKAVRRSQFTGELSSSGVPGKWADWKNEDAASIASLQDKSLREQKALDYLRHRSSVRKKRRMILGWGSVVGGVTLLGLYLVVPEVEMTWYERTESRRPVFLLGAGVFAASAVLNFAWIPAEEKAYKSYFKEKLGKPEMGLLLIRDVGGQTEIRLQVSLAVN